MDEEFVLNQKCRTGPPITFKNSAWCLPYYIQDADNDTRLHVLIAGLPDKKDFIKRLIRSTWPSSLLKLKNKNNVSPLAMASMIGDAEIVRELVIAAPGPVSYDRWGYTPMHYACEIGSADVVTALVKPFNVNEMSRMQLKDLLIPNSCSIVNARNNSGETPLHLAVEHGHFEIVKLLLKLGADVHAMERYNEFRPLVVAIKKRNKLIANLLLEYCKEHQHKYMHDRYACPKLIKALKEMGLIPTFNRVLDISDSSSSSDESLSDG